jgi:hypothetical protein
VAPWCLDAASPTARVRRCQVLYPLIVRDFLDRAEHVYPDRVAIVDEPEQPAPSLGEIT